MAIAIMVVFWVIR